MKKVSYKHTQRWRTKARRWITIYAGGKCQICGYDKYYGNLVFHHIDQTTKFEDVCRLINMTASWDVILKEADKCVMVCHNCHNEIHAEIVNCPNINLEQRKQALLELENERPKAKNKTFHGCKVCGKSINMTLIFCSHECCSKSSEKVNWPENLPELVKNSSKSAVARELGVSGRAVAKRLLKYH